MMSLMILVSLVTSWCHVWWGLRFTWCLKKRTNSKEVGICVSSCEKAYCKSDVSVLMRFHLVEATPSEYLVTSRRLRSSDYNYN